MSLVCANRICRLSPLQPSDARAEIKAVVPKGFNVQDASHCVQWKAYGEAAFHPDCWVFVLKLARARGQVSRKRKRPNSTTTNGGGVVSESAVTMNQTEKLMVKQAAKTVEHFDAWEKVRKAAKTAAELIKKASHCIAFTGAGISTSAGLGDFRGKSGKWTEEDNAAAACSFVEESQTSSHQSNEEEEEEENVDYENLRPTYTHEALKLLADRKLVHFVISQNCDGLHPLSGLDPDQLSELHGNVFVEKCGGCNKRYRRQYYVLHDAASQYYEELQDLGATDVVRPEFADQCKKCGLCHRTGRKCQDCGEFLEDTIINFRDLLEDSMLNRAMEEAKKSDVILCLGSTLTVTPAADIVDQAKGNLPLVICNRQRTEKDGLAAVQVFGDCDTFMKELLGELIGKKDRQQFETLREERMAAYNAQRPANPPANQNNLHQSDNPATSDASRQKKNKKTKGKAK